MSNTLGVYKITNKLNNKIYIGESHDIERRWLEHKEELNNNIHHSYKLQNDWNIYGESNFKFEVIEEIDKLDSPYKTTMQLIYVEGKYIDQYDSIASGYNVENTVEEVLSGKKVIMSKLADAKYLIRLIHNNGLNAKINNIPNLIDACTELKKEGYILKKPIQQFVTKEILIKQDNTYCINDIFINKGYFLIGKQNKNIINNLKYRIFVTNLGKQFIIDKLELKKKEKIASNK